MSCPNKSPRTFVLKLNLYCANCGDCVKKVKKIVRNIHGVDSIDIDTEKGLATISGKVDPNRVIKELKKDKKINAELVGEEKSLLEMSKQVLQIHEVDDSINAEEESPSRINKQELQIVLQQNHVQKILDQRKVAPQLPDLINKTIGQLKAITIPNGYPKHKHELELKSYNKPFKCNGCKEEGFKRRYRCELCDYDLHKECMSPKPTITHEFYEGSTFVFSQKPRNICDACGRKIHGYSYRCKEKDMDLHPLCANLKGKVCIGGTDFVLQKKVKDNCLWCKKKRPTWLAQKDVEGWCYVSKQNKFYCHVYCVSQMVHEAWRRGDLDRKDEDDDASMALEKLDLKLVANMERSGGRGGSAFFKTVAIFLRTVLGVLFGDPTVLLFSMLVEVVSK